MAFGLPAVFWVLSGEDSVEREGKACLLLLVPVYGRALASPALRVQPEGPGDPAP